MRHYWKQPDARELLNGSVREGSMESRHSIKIYEHKNTNIKKHIYS